MADKDQKLFAGFPPVSDETWEAAIHADLKGRDYGRALVWKTYEGINVLPYYRRHAPDAAKYSDALPGDFPYARGNKERGNDWLVRQDIIVKDFAEANKKALDILGKGITSLGFIFDCQAEVTLMSLEILLKDICTKAVELNFSCGCKSCNIALVFAEFVAAQKKDAGKIYGSSSADPIGSLVFKGKLVPDAFSALKEAIEKTAALENFRVISVHGKTFADSGASLVQELAFSLAQGVEYLSGLTEAGLKVDDVAKNIKFNFGIGNNYFMEIAKLRAARLLWAQIVKAYSPEHEDSARMIAHSETNAYNKSIYDPYVNMLRTQTEAMSAVLGGADSITVLPFNAVYEDTTDFSERIARNQQILLKEEAHLDKVADPGAGSYYIENLTASLAEYTWNLFLQVQEKGGFVKAFREGFIQAEIKAVAAKRDANVSLRRENVLGVNQFPNFSEVIKDEFSQQVFQATDLSAEDAEAETLKPYRVAQPFEALRYKTDLFARANRRPAAFMLTLGNLAMRKARAQFSCNFFAVAGFEVIDNNGFQSVKEGVEAAREKQADIVVLCSSDDEYAAFAPQAAELLNDEILVIAGNPACKSDLEARGIKNFVHVKSNALEELKEYQKQLGI